MDWLKMVAPMGAVKMEAAGGEGGGGDPAPAGGAGGEGGADPAPQGALGGGDNPAPAGGEGGEAQGYDWEHATADDYFSKVAPKLTDGVEFNPKIAALRYGQFCIDNKIPPEVLTQYLEMEGKFVADQNREASERQAKEDADVRKNFEAQGAVLKRDFSPQQIQSAVDVLGRDFAGDKDFMRYATREMSNNPSLVKLLVNWAETHQVDTGTGAGKGAGALGGRGFASTWTGKNYG